MASKCKTVFITGCNRPNGIGFGLVTQILERLKPEHLFASCRNKSEAKELNELAGKFKNLHVVQLDVNDEQKCQDVANYVDEVTDGQGVNLLINNAGIFLRPQESIAQLNQEALMKHFEVNVIGPIFLTKTFLPLLEKAANKSSSPVGVGKSTILMMSTKMASIDDNTGGGAYLYRTSKTALNMATKTMSLELKKKGILTVLMHPGWVQTDMGGPNGLLTTEQSVSGITSVLEKLGADDNGKFLQYDGQEIPW